MTSVLADLETSKLPEKEKALFRLVRKTNEDARSITREEVEAVRAAGWPDEAIFDAITVSSLFNFYNRWCDANGARDMLPASYEMSGVRLATGGYTPDEKPPVK